ncbi:hypothetical protein KEJ45_06825 [Candidatus Bathyarchaeota archaeon]|nr:hypothetical protein [Candidatus Bathyarchaeota archaeon]
MSQKAANLFLPFSVLSENRKEPFTEDMEKAAIYCLTETEREKGSGLILKKPEETIVFLTKLYYPFWLAAWNELNLIFDGLKQSTHTITYKLVPDVKAFVENAYRSIKSMETYVAFLSDNVNYFQASSNDKTLVLEALIADFTFLNEFDQYVSEARQAETGKTETVLLDPLMDESAVVSTIEELEKLKSSFEAEINNLNESMKLLNRTTRSFVKEIRGEIKTIKEEFEEKIRKEEEVVTQKISKINEEYDEQRVKLTKAFEKELMPLQKEKVKLEKTKDEMLQKIEKYDIEAKSCAANKDSIGEKKWKEKIGETKKELSEIEKRLEEVEDKIKENEENHSAETFRLRSNWESRIKEARQDLLELEASRDAKIQVYMQEIGKLESLTANIIQQLGNIIKMRETDLAGFQKLGIPQKHKRLNIVYVPFYIACYQAETKKRSVVFSPSVANSVGLTARLKSALGRTKIKQLLTPRFKVLSSLLDKLPTLMERDAAFAREIYEAGEKADVFRKESARDHILKGLKKLKEEGWLSDKEFEDLNQKLA